MGDGQQETFYAVIESWESEYKTAAMTTNLILITLLLSSIYVF